MSSIVEALPAERLFRLCDSTAKVWIGILNITPDSFSDGGDFLNLEEATRRASEMVERGASIIDVGGMSTRPGSAPVAEDEEERRVLPVCQALRKTLGTTALISVDTSKPRLAKLLAEQGLVDAINDVMAGGETSNNISTIEVAAQFGLGLFLMHMQGTPALMQLAPEYSNCVDEVIAFLRARAEMAVAAGVRFVAVDPGIGFGKTTAHNLQLLEEQAIAKLAALGFPVMIGLSRKRFIGEVFASDPIDMSKPKNRDRRSKELEERCFRAGAKLVRTHCLPTEV